MVQQMCRMLQFLNERKDLKIHIQGMTANVQNDTNFANERSGLKIHITELSNVQALMIIIHQKQLFCKGMAYLTYRQLQLLNHLQDTQMNFNNYLSAVPQAKNPLYP